MILPVSSVYCAILGPGGSFPFVITIQYEGGDLTHFHPVFLGWIVIWEACEIKETRVVFLVTLDSEHSEVFTSSQEIV